METKHTTRENMDTKVHQFSLVEHSDCSIHSPKVLIFGGRRGLLGQALSYILSYKNWDVFNHGYEDVDLLNPYSLHNYISSVRPDYIINAIGYTHIDQAEYEADIAYSLNQAFPKLLAEIAKEDDIFLVTFSTDRIFDGLKNIPYLEEDPPHPLSVYGLSKLAGEQEILKANLQNVLIVRTSWLFGPWKDNFVQRIVDLASKKRLLPVEHDQISSPTYTLDLAHYTYMLLNKGATGIYHVSNSGQASWCELAAEAISTAGSTCSVQAIHSSPSAEQSILPRFSVLDLSKFLMEIKEKPRPWPKALREYVFCYCTETIYNYETD